MILCIMKNYWAIFFFTKIDNYNRIHMISSLPWHAFSLFDFICGSFDLWVIYFDLCIGFILCLFSFLQMSDDSPNRGLPALSFLKSLECFCIFKFSPSYTVDLLLHFWICCSKSFMYAWTQISVCILLFFHFMDDN